MITGLNSLKERYSNQNKKDNKTIMTLRSQAKIGLAVGIFFIIEILFFYVINLEVPAVVSKIIGICILIFSIIFLLFVKIKCKMEANDELSIILMKKGISVSAYSEIIFVFTIGIVMSIIGYKRGNDSFVITSHHVIAMALLMLGIHFVVKYGVYLLLDRIPEGYDEEE